MPTATTNNIAQAMAAERTRLTERIGKLQADIEKLQAELAGFDTVERVMTRFGVKTPATPARTGAAAASGKRRGRPVGSTKTPKARSTSATGGITLGVACQNVVAKYPGFTPAQIMASLKSEYGLTPRPNHLGIALQREHRARRLQVQGTGPTAMWYTPAAFAKAA